jgi:uncharacterized repeat protein (TIGR02059 family)
MRIILLLIFLTISSLASATNYYVSSSTGNDALDGKSAANAWKTISKVNGKTFLPGDSILFKEGDSWRETLIVSSSGVAGNYINYSSYGSGTGVNPRILGSTRAITWTQTSTNVWKSATTFSSNPYTSLSTEIFFVNMDSTRSWGTYKSGTSGLGAEYDWTWVTSNIYVYSTTDPTTKYAAVEVPQRESTVNMNKKNYIHFDGIDMRYSYWSGYGYDFTHNDMYEQFGLIIENSEIGCIGAWDPSIEQGYGIEVVYSDMIVRNNVFHDCGRRGFAMDVYGSGYTARDILVEDNEFYNGFHTTGLDIDVGAGYTGSLDSITVRRNFFYETSKTRSSDFSNLIFIQNNNTGACSITNVLIYSNIFKWPNGYGILMENAQSVFIYNNVFYDKNVNATWAPFIAAQGSTHATVKNNILFESSGSATDLEKNSYTTNDYNLFYNCTVSGSETHGVFGKNPLFVNPAINDFHLQPASPAIGVGTSIVGVSTDYDNLAFTNPPNIGCFATPLPTSNPVFLSASIENATPSLLEITFNKTLANIVPATSAFTVKVNSVSRSVTAITISGAKVQLTLASQVSFGDVITVAYTKPASNPIQASTGEATDSFTAQPVTNNVASTIPVYVSSVVGNATPTLLEMTYSFTLANIVPATSAFTVTVNSVNRPVNTVTVSGTLVRLTLASAINYGDVVTVSYTKPASNPLQSLSGGQSVSISNKSVTNNVNPAIPAYVSSAIENATSSLLEITFSLTLATVTPSSSAFVVNVNSAVRSVNSVVIAGNKVQLTLSGAVFYGDVVTVAYNKPASNPLQTSSGGQVATFTAKTVTNNVSPATPIYVSSVIQNATPTILEMTYQLTLANIVPATSAFTVTVNSTSRTIISVGISGTKVRLTLSSGVNFGDIVMVSYTKPAVNPLQTSSGGQAATLSASSVTNNLNPPVPNYISSVIESASPSVLSISFDQVLAGIIPDASAFTVLVNSVPRTISSVTITGSVVRISLQTPVVNGNVITISYSKPVTNPLQTPAGAQAVSFTSQPVTNNVGIVNVLPVIQVIYRDTCTGGFVGEIDASGTTDADNDMLVFTWTTSGRVDISSTTSSKIQFLAPIVSTPEAFDFSLNVSDGKGVVTKDFSILIIPYRPELSKSLITQTTASSYLDSDLPLNISDGNLETFWSASGDNQWLTCKLKDPFRIDHLKLSFSNEDMGGSFFDILASKDSLEWDPLITNATSCGFSTNLQIFNLDQANSNAYSYIKFIGHGNSLGPMNKISELQVYGVATLPSTEFLEIGMTIYPNPASEVINIFFRDSPQESQTIRVSDYSGKIFYEKIYGSGQNYLQIPVTFPPGFYLVHLISKGTIKGVSKLTIK